MLLMKAWDGLVLGDEIDVIAGLGQPEDRQNRCQLGIRLLDNPVRHFDAVIPVLAAHQQMAVKWGAVID